MKKTLKLVVVMSILFLVASNAWAVAIDINYHDYVYMAKDAIAPYSLTDINDNITYASFCLETNKYFAYGNNRVTSVGDYATSGGSGGAVLGRDYLSDKTKWLYAAYASGEFADVAGADDKVQKTIWSLEGENGGYNYWNVLSASAVGFDATGWEVVAVNIEYYDRNARRWVEGQSQLIGVGPTASVPEPAAMLLLGTGLLGLAGVGRKRLKNK